MKRIAAILVIAVLMPLVFSGLACKKASPDSGAGPGAAGAPSEDMKAKFGAMGKGMGKGSTGGGAPGAGPAAGPAKGPATGKGE